jgi:hypothetical protein
MGPYVHGAIRAENWRSIDSSVCGVFPPQAAFCADGVDVVVEGPDIHGAIKAKNGR